MALFKITVKQTLLTKWNVKEIRAKQKKYRYHVYSNEEIEKMVSKKVGLNQVLATEYSTAMENLLKKLEEARNNKDYNLLYSE